MEQIFTTHSREAKARVRAEYLHRVTIIWSSPLGVQEKAAAHNSWAVAVVRYYMPLLEWYRRDLLDVQTRKVLVQCGAHNTAASCARVYLHRSRDGRDLDALTFVWEVEVLSSALYLKRVADQHVEGAVAFMEDYERKQTILGLAVQILERYRLFCSLLGVVETGAEAERQVPGEGGERNDQSAQEGPAGRLAGGSACEENPWHLHEGAREALSGQKAVGKVAGGRQGPSEGGRRHCGGSGWRNSH